MADALHNNPPSPAETFKDRLQRSKTKAATYEDFNDENAQRYRDEIGLIGDLKKEIEEQHKTEKAPHLEAGRLVDNTYKPLASECEDVVKAMRRKLGTWMDAREREAQAKAAEAARKLREAEEAARKAQEPEEDPFLAATAGAAEYDVKAAHAEAKVAEAEALAAGRVSSAAGGFKAAGLKTIRKAKVTDWSALVAHYAGHREVRELCERLANADIRHAKGNPVTIGGIEIVEERVL